ncbi:uncharacterized protein LOC112900493 [Panicum hallii]|uniref:uncharacterized protein LOC112900493 n=1 Tax=Panicum hallii TaxID=206008 RepID=UPI000DF4CCC2|nr:uncharacterized protein LOC112900493 [Panicum hallii]
MEVTTSAADAAVINSDWRVPLLAYLLDKVLPTDRTEAQRMYRHAKTFLAIDGELYKRSPSGIGMLMKCILTQQGKELLLEIYPGIWGHHAAPQSLDAVKFFLDIVYRFSVPNTIITDNRSNFTGKRFLEFADGYGIRIDWASVGHPRTNGQVERANGMVL